MRLRRTHINLSAAQRRGLYQRLGITENRRQPERTQVTLWASSGRHTFENLAALPPSPDRLSSEERGV